MSRLWPKLLRLIVACNFGRGSQHPLLSGLFRILGAILLAFWLGQFAVRAITHLNFNGLPLNSLVLLSGLTGFVSVGLTATVISSVSAETNDSAGWRRQAALWPLRPGQRVGLELTPYLLIWLILIVGLVQIGWVVAKQAGLPGYLIAASLGLSALGGAALGPLKAPAAMKGIGLILTSVLFGKITEVTLINSAWYWLGFAGLFWLPILGLVATGQITSNPKSYRFIGLPQGLLRPGWYLLKLWRNRRGMASTGFCLGLAASLAAGIHWRHLVVGNEMGLLTFAGLLSAVLASDLRGLSRRFRMPENCLKGGYFDLLIKQWLAAFISGFILCSPLLLIVITEGSPGWLTVFQSYVGLVTYGTVAGLLAGSLLAAQKADFGKQFFTGATATALFWQLLKMAHLAEPVSVWLSRLVFWFLICLVVAYLIEEQRRRNYGHV